MWRLHNRCLITIVIVLLLGDLTAARLDLSMCADDVNGIYAQDRSAITLLDQFGKPTTDKSTAWGIEYSTCKRVCQAKVNRQSYSWDFLSQGLAAWFLPWLALAAQLPFDTKDRFSALTALVIGLGSPMVIAYSLALTILNSRTINSKFRQLRNHSQEWSQETFTDILNAARVIMMDCQHIPIQIVNGSQRELPQLIVRPENWTWWTNLRREIQLTKKRWTYPMFAQIAMVCVFQILTIIAFFTVKSSFTSIGMGCAINSLWVWIVPVVLGWVFIGTQTSAGSVRAAIMKTTVPVLGSAINVKGKCVAIRDRTRFDLSCVSVPPAIRLTENPSRNREDSENQRIPSDAAFLENAETERYHSQNDLVDEASSNVARPVDYRVSSQRDTYSAEPYQSFSSSFNPVDDLANDKDCETAHLGPISPGDLEQQRLPQHEEVKSARVISKTFLSFIIAGYEVEPGSIFNYARIYSHMNAVHHVTQAFGQLIAKQLEHISVNGRDWDDTPAHWRKNLQGTPLEMSRYISSTGSDAQDLSIHASASSSTISNAVIAAITANVLQWGSTGPAIMIAYKTPVIGLGCQSGSYLIYGLSATLSWLILVTSSYLSHLHSTIQQRTLTVTSSKSKRAYILGAAAVTLRLAGTILAAANALFLIVTSALQFTGLYDTCWCDACIPSNGYDTPWVILFATDEQISGMASSAWGSGTAISIVSMVVVTAFMVWSRGDEIWKSDE